MKTQQGGLTGGDSEGGEERARARALAAPTSRGHTRRQKTDLKLWHARVPIQSPTQQPVDCRQEKKRELCFRCVRLLWYVPGALVRKLWYSAQSPESMGPRVLSSRLPGGGGRART